MVPMAPALNGTYAPYGLRQHAVELFKQQLRNHRTTASLLHLSRKRYVRERLLRAHLEEVCAHGGIVYKSYYGRPYNITDQEAVIAY